MLPDAATGADLQTFLARARQVDPGAAVRLVASGGILAVYASALHGAGAPTVLALRVLAAPETGRLDLTVPVAALTDRFALIERQAPADRNARPDLGGPVRVPLPPSVGGSGATWAGMLPPRSGWSLEGLIRLPDLRQAARSGIDEVAAGTPAAAGAAAVARLRAMVWGRPMVGHPQLPAGAAFAIEAFGFLGPSRGRGFAGPGGAEPAAGLDEAVSLHRCGPWWRLSATRGYVLARRPSGLA